MVTNAAHFLPRVPFGVCHGTANRASLFARPLDGPTRILYALAVSVNQRRLGVWRVPPCLPRSLSRLPRDPAPEYRAVRIVAPLPFQFARHDSGYHLHPRKRHTVSQFGHLVSPCGCCDSVFEPDVPRTLGTGRNVRRMSPATVRAKPSRPQRRAAKTTQWGFSQLAIPLPLPP